MTDRKRLNAIYDVLVADCGADENDRMCFTREIRRGCHEYRCCHALGFGGKFRPETCSVNYYPEDRTDERDKIQAEVNRKLWEIVEIPEEILKLGEIVADLNASDPPVEEWTTT